MKQRQTHSKSRRGCLNCKKRHVKCDEQGPPCANCVVRKTTCSYGQSPTASAAQLDAPAHLDPSSCLAVGLPSETSQSSGSSSLSPPQASRMPSPSETSFSSSPELQPSPEPRRLLELELMHRWSTHTYLVMTCHPEEYPLMQTVLPREGLRHDFVLRIMFALTSLDLAVHVAQTEADAASYVRSALAYHDAAALALDRHVRARAAHHAHDWLAHVATAAHTAYQLAVFSATRAGGTARSRAAAIFALWSQAAPSGAAAADAGLDALLAASPATALQSLLRLPASIDACDAATRAPLARLYAVNDALHEPAAYYPDSQKPTRATLLHAEQSQPQPQQGPPVSRHEMYRRAVFHLGTCFAEDATGLVPGHSASFPSVAGPGFAAAVGGGEPLALLVVMHWGVLLHRMGLRCWWAAGVGACLVAELSEALPETELAFLPAAQEGVAWARGEVGLAVWGAWDPAMSAGIGLS
ncbi:Sterol uptake control protein 2 like [Verticillium longisporum]|uniref:Sterol uptake control protein 2 like n=1 Tax=Verticillium longisporum TaxID=100787 RepID=A0A8I3A0A8_VERLO|nr:Sterol uptake control protein 2 like [Verticillium longisporum]